ncbi:MarR family transcriptional regulator [Nodosilinea sp. P-1105]|uniref:MarR family transcriptional regulator n=1 Tax=Nodosilinea sp. P-1105 TaxID=2546229 RepID=UPI00146F6F41|nr:MarR family transcriptional regulator [Nodosilinea sp. P-1105]NMF84182.1 MarR family transcriptional regulator [Nodosilinea sp. P-1105]
MSNQASDREALLQANLQLGRELSARTLMFHAAVSDRVGLSAVEHKALDLLSRAGTLTAGQLAELTGLTTGAITGLVDRLEKAGFVRRDRDPSDRRKVVIQPVLEKMEAEIAPLFADLGQQMEELLSGYSDQELAIIQDFVSRSIAVLQAETTKLSENPASAETP